MCYLYMLAIAAAAVGLALPAAAQADRATMLDSMAQATIISEACPHLRLDQRAVDYELLKVRGATLAELRQELPAYIRAARNRYRNAPREFVCEGGLRVFGPSGAGVLSVTSP